MGGNKPHLTDRLLDSGEYPGVLELISPGAVPVHHVL